MDPEPQELSAIQYLGVGLQSGSVQANMATWSKAELEIAMGMTQDCSRAHELGNPVLPICLCRTCREVIISNGTASVATS